MDKLHRALHLQHHKHTGKLLGHHHTSYRAIMVLLVVAGAAIVSMNVISRASADALLSVSATVAVPAPTVPATITSPADGAVETTGATLVAGNCPFTSPQPVILVAVDGATVGSARCDDANQFALPLSLTAGSHSIAAQAASITGGLGPASAAVHVRTPNGLAASTDTPVITPAEPFVYLDDDRTAVWAGAISGSTPPYQVHIDWGDGKVETHTLGSGPQQLTHRYQAAGSHNIYLTVASGEHFATAQYAVATPTTAVAPAAAAPSDKAFVDTSTAFGLYGLYITVLAVFGVIWLEAKHAGRHIPVMAH